MTVFPALQRIQDLKANFNANNAMRVFITRVNLNDIHHISRDKAFVDAMERQRAR